MREYFISTLSFSLRMTESSALPFIETGKGRWVEGRTAGFNHTEHEKLVNSSSVQNSEKMEKNTYIFIIVNTSRRCGTGNLPIQRDASLRKIKEFCIYPILFGILKVTHENEKYRNSNIHHNSFWQYHRMVDTFKGVN